MAAAEHSRTPPKAKMSLERLMQASVAIETPRMVQKWALVLAGVSSVIAISLSIAVAALVPLKEFVPYFVVERADGSVERAEDVGQRFVADAVNLQYFGARFVRDLLTIDEQMRFRLPQTFTFTRGAATAQWRQFVSVDDRPQARLSEDPTLRRQITIEGSPQIINAAPGARTGTIVFFVRETTASGRVASTTRRVRVTLDYVLSPPADLNAALENPIGFFVTNIRYEVIA